MLEHIKTFFLRPWAWFFRLWRRAPEESVPERDEILPYRVAFVDARPDSLDAATCYIVGENGYHWCAMFLCPCGCGAEVVLNLLPEVRPRWSVEVCDDRTVTLYPSVNRTTGCRSHFFVRRGRVIFQDRVVLSRNATRG